MGKALRTGNCEASPKETVGLISLDLYIGTYIAGTSCRGDKSEKKFRAMCCCKCFKRDHQEKRLRQHESPVTLSGMGFEE